MVALVEATNVALSALPLVVMVRVRQMGADPFLIGILLAFPGTASIAGSARRPWLQRHIPARVISAGSLLIWASTIAASS